MVVLKATHTFLSMHENLNENELIFNFNDYLRFQAHSLNSLTDIINFNFKKKQYVFCFFSFLKPIPENVSDNVRSYSFQHFM